MVTVTTVGHMAPHAGHQQHSPATPPPGRAGVGVVTVHRTDSNTPPSSGHGHANHLSPHHPNVGHIVHPGGHHPGPHGGPQHPQHLQHSQHHPSVALASQVMPSRTMPMSPSVGAPTLCSTPSGPMLRSPSPQPHHALHPPQHSQHSQHPHIHAQQADQQTQHQAQPPNCAMATMHSKVLAPPASLDLE